MVGLVLVSHSPALVGGLRDLLNQMEPDVAIGVAGGTDDGELGTSLDLVNAALAEGDTGDGAVVLFDLGSAEMTAESALEFLGSDRRTDFVVVDAPLVEGALAAIGVAAGGAPLDDVAEAARAAGGSVSSSDEQALSDDGADQHAEVTLRNRHGLHARPAGQLVRAIRAFDARVVVERVDTGEHATADGVLGLVGLGAGAGTTIAVRATGNDADAAIERVVDLVEGGFGEPDADMTHDEAAGHDSEQVDAQRPLAGPLGASGGLAVGPARWLRLPEPALPDPDDGPDDGSANDRERLEEAKRAVRDHLTSSDDTDAVFAAQAELLDDPTITDAVRASLDEGHSAARAWWRAVSAQRDRIGRMSDDVFAARAADIDDVGRRVLEQMGIETGTAAPEAGEVVVADDLSPGQVRTAYDAGAVGAVVRGGTRTAHMAIVARTLGLPLVLRAGDQLDEIDDGVVIVVDGDEARVEIGPSDQRRDEIEDTVAARAAEQQRRRTAAQQRVTRADGTTIEVAANIASVSEAELAVRSGADAVGLIRTEFLFGERSTLPDTDEQVNALRPVLAALDGRHAIVRTLDVGGDKPSGALDLDTERNGFLGVRGIRLSLERPDIFGTQLRALLRLADEFALSIMFPFVTRPGEVVAARRHLQRAHDDLVAAGYAAGAPRAIGMMVEIPVAALNPDAFVDHVDFFSVGTNDLSQYLAAAGRTIDEVSALADETTATVERVIGDLCTSASTAGKWVGVCGEMAGDPDTAARLVDLGVTELSMAPVAIPDVKRRLLQSPAE